ncbi:MarR family winged helix-turn-helix transcriptional regulator [Nocardia sp. NPDC056000]|uniref:MarR family winged helix-turn-helix transcriptional regulator n=1 Tax=Nocardia sp. NPDC056000 TaxID=3345674 RepID=UPI0035E00AEE
MASGDDGLIYDPGVRQSMHILADGQDSAMEAAAALRLAWQAVDKLRTSGAGGRGLSTGALDVLGRLAVSDHDLSIGELARMCGVSSRNITGLVDTLAAKDLAERTPDPHDRRGVRVSITPAGHEWLESFREPTRRAMAAIFAGFTPDDLAQLRHLSLRVVQNQRRIQHYLDNSEPPTS